MNMSSILKIIAIVLQLIASGLSEGKAVGEVSEKFGVAAASIRKFL